MVQHADIDHTGLTGVGGGAIADYDEWVNRAGTTSLNGLITFTNVARQATGGPSTGGGSNGAYLYGTNGSGSPYDIAAISGLTEGSLLLVSAWVQTGSGGGTFGIARMNADGKPFMIPHNDSAQNATYELSGTWTYWSYVGVVGADGTWKLRGVYQLNFADLRVRVIAP